MISVLSRLEPMMIRTLFVTVLLLTFLPQVFSQAQLRIKGRIIDRVSGEFLQFAHVGIMNTAWGTVTNSNGEFSLIIPQMFSDSTLVASYLGYANATVSLATVDPSESLTIGLAAEPIELPELIIGTKNKSIVEEAVEAIPDNHALNEMAMTAFWRGQIENRDTTIQLSETVFDIFRHGDGKKKRNDLKILKGRISRDSTAFGRLHNLQAGVTPETLFAVSFLEDHGLLSKKTLKNHQYTVVDVKTFDGKNVYVVEFDKKADYDENGYAGSMLIETETLAFVKITYNFSPKNTIPIKLFSKKVGKWTGLGESVRDRQYTDINFQKVNDKWYLSHVQYDAQWTLVTSDINYNENIRYYADFVVTDIQTEDIVVPPKEELAKNRILERQADYSGENFWEDFNYLEPDQDFEQLFREIRERNEIARINNNQDGNE